MNLCAAIFRKRSRKWKQITIILRETLEHLSNPQRRFYRGVVLPHFRNMMSEAGDIRSKAKWHEVLLEEFAPETEVQKLNGEIVTRPKRSGNEDEDMDKAEMITFLTAILAECAVRGEPVRTQGYEDWNK